jgi:predicted transcriptional regulator of viral defense system
LVIDNMRYRVVHLRNERFFGIVQRMSVRRHIPITDREKTVIDALDRPDLCGGIRHLAVALLDRCTQIDWDKVDNYLHRFASGAVYKRLGYVVEAFDLPLPQRDDHLARWQSNLTAGIAELDPSEPGPGRNHMRWRIRDNIMLDSLNPRTFHDS